ncbi:immunoglobulin domain-containing family protein [Thermoflexibacter ruber]|uniref:Lipocalin-like domain-containing protein n=1 Tax=Thermoflexibacter ruber TaxID=1003 RepID=A0A1I2I5M5_9BACT|nr:hypothetical protein [Thermoflexibacter ruber]SFF37769.1 hypothetical protein SAMN04488541_102922 [Thermoflexibacter ruber]
MKKLILMLALVLALSSCTKKEDAAPEIVLSELNGTWKGTVNIIQKGTCTFEPTQYNISMLWQVDSNGDVTINEKLLEGDNPTIHTWKGKIVEQEIRLETLPEIANCRGIERQITFSMKAKITKQQGKYQITAFVDFPICPDMNCLFELRYEASK